MITTSNRGLWLACCLLLSTNVGLIGGILSHISGGKLAEAIISGATSFAATVTLTLLVLSFYQHADSRSS
jgi:hypothetical protein